MHNNCIFCKILTNDMPASIVYRDEICTAFMDIQPVNQGHILIVPNKHCELIADLDDATASHLFVVGKKINIALRKTNIKCEGINYFLADGEAAFQEINHTHLHCFPRFKGDGFGLKFNNNYRNKPPKNELDKIALEIKKYIY